MVPTKTRRKKWEIDAEWTRLQSELHTVVVNEFPVGTKVRWLHGVHVQTGVVIASPRYSFERDVSVRNSKTGSTKRVDAADLEIEQ